MLEGEGYGVLLVIENCGGTMQNRKALRNAQRVRQIETLIGLVGGKLHVLFKLITSYNSPLCGKSIDTAMEEWIGAQNN